MVRSVPRTLEFAYRFSRTGSAIRDNSVLVSAASKTPHPKHGGRKNCGLAWRLGPGLGVPFLVVMVLAGCTGGESDASPSTVPRIGATNYVTQPVVTMTPSTVPGATTPAGGTARGEQEYQVRRGDYVSSIANRYNITADQLADYNDWDSINHLIVPGDIIKIPPFADVPEIETTVETLFIQGGPLCPDGTEQDTYEVQSGDYLGKVAENLAVTVEQLDEANKFTPGYASFYPALEILVPCPGDGTAASSPEMTVGN